MRGRRTTPMLLFSAVILSVAAGPARAINCIDNLYDNGTVPSGRPLFPNWNLAWVGSFDFWMFGTDAVEQLKGITIVNFAGTGPNAAQAVTDIKNVYVRAWCATDNTGYLTLTYAGIYTRTTDPGPPPATSSDPAWTWAGTSADLGGCAEVYAGGGAKLTLDVYVDIASCPGDGKQVWMGLPANFSTTFTGEGAITDAPWGCQQPWYDATPAVANTIYYVTKEGDKQFAAPGDTVTFTIRYGKPGAAANLTGIEIIDSLPAYTHYVPGSAVPPPVPGWDPDAGPPNRLLWTFGSTPTAGGPTNEIIFKATVDWGNGESFEPGSGDIAAPEGSRLANRAMGFFNGAGACSWAVSPPASTVVRRFMFWLVGDNDMLFSQSLGQPPDEITYTAFVRNMSATKTWWNVQIWDTVPGELNSWCVNCGFDDPCLGWTMTPSGCAAASPGKLSNASRTLLTWTLDMPPGYTIELRWKAQVYSTIPGGSTAINKIGLWALGNARVLNGTGHSIIPRQFTHQAPIILPTTYISYVAYAASDDNPCTGFFIDFFPLNKKTQFELRGIEYNGAAPSYASTGGVSESIGCLIGDCLNGFPGNGACALGDIAVLPGGGIAGCKVERIPAKYEPLAYYDVCVLAQPFNLIYKLTSNSPVAWQLLTHTDNVNQDRHTYAPSSNLTFTGFVLYTWPSDFTAGSSFSMINTGLDVYKTDLSSTLQTTVHAFTYDYATLNWEYLDTWELGPESQATFILDQYGGTNAFNPSSSPMFKPFRFISSDASLIVNCGMTILNTLTGNCAGTDNHGALAPTRENGYTVALPGTGASYYGICNPVGCGAGDGIVIVGNVGATDATYKLWVYTPDNTVVGQVNCPVLLRDSVGSWKDGGTYVVPAGIATACNPDFFGNVFPLNRGSSELFKVELISGGPVQVTHGSDPWSGWGGGSVIHGSDGTPMSNDYWIHAGAGRNPRGTGCPNDTSVVDVFVPKSNTVVRQFSSDVPGGLGSFTTNGPDQCVAFKALTSAATSCTGRRNWEYTLTGSDGIAMWEQCTTTEKGFTAPFLQTGVHYQIITPPVVYLGQSFWITILVLGPGVTTANTETGYCSITSFTSTDPGAKLGGQPMDSYNYTWDTNSTQSPCGAGNPCVGGVCGACSGTCDNGVKVLVNVQMTTLGYQTIVAVDINDGSVVGISALQVVAADVKLTKEPALQVVASGDAPQFKICWSNYSSATASSFTINDRVPSGMTYYPDTPSNHLCGATKGFGAATVAYSTDGGSTYSTLTGPATTAVTNLRWTIPTVGVATTGCVCFRVTVQ